MLPGTTVYQVPEPPGSLDNAPVPEVLHPVTSEVELGVEHVLDHAPELGELPVPQLVVGQLVQAGHLRKEVKKGKR